MNRISKLDLHERTALLFLIFATLTIAGAAVAMSRRNLVHAVLALTAAFLGLALVYLQLGAQFIGLAQILVYVGAVSILVVFAILLTRGPDEAPQAGFSANMLESAVVILAIFGVLAWAIRHSAAISHAATPQPPATMQQIGTSLMLPYALPLEIIGVLLTAALIGAVTIALQEKGESK